METSRIGFGEFLSVGKGGQRLVLQVEAFESATQFERMGSRAIWIFLALVGHAFSKCEVGPQAEALRRREGGKRGVAFWQYLLGDFERRKESN